MEEEREIDVKFKKMKLLKNIIGLISPTLLVFIFLSFFSSIKNFPFSILLFIYFSAVPLTGFYISRVNKYKFCNKLILPLSFLFLSVSIYIPGQFYSKYDIIGLYYGMVTVFYSVPFFFISLINSILVGIKNSKIKKMLVSCVAVIAIVLYVIAFIPRN